MGNLEKFNLAVILLSCFSTLLSILTLILKNRKVVRDIIFVMINLSFFLSASYLYLGNKFSSIVWLICAGLWLLNHKITTNTIKRLKEIGEIEQEIKNNLKEIEENDRKIQEIKNKDNL